MWIVVQITPGKPDRALPQIHYDRASALGARAKAKDAFSNTGCSFYINRLVTLEEEDAA
ncbi:MAG TPA: hypothetical protein VFS91_01440 [Nitrobacter sp.]|nr:hypothetical protein [Nitrobacter sp.]